MFDCVIFSSVLVSMPSNGQHSFLLGLLGRRGGFSDCVNALKRATLISTRWRVLLTPCTGSCVNALKRATLISTAPPEIKMSWLLKGVNALKRATLISTNSLSEAGRHGFDVSMPSNGQHSFLQGAREKEIERYRCVNALKRATLISTPEFNTRG